MYFPVNTVTVKSDLLISTKRNIMRKLEEGGLGKAGRGLKTGRRANLLVLNNCAPGLSQERRGLI